MVKSEYLVILVWHSTVETQIRNSEIWLNWSKYPLFAILSSCFDSILHFDYVLELFLQHFCKQNNCNVESNKNVIH